MFRLKVTPQALKSASQEISDSIENVNKQLIQIGNIIKASPAYWEGDASATHQKHYESITEEIDAVIGDLKEYPVALLAMAGVYEEEEKNIKEMAMELPANIFQ